MINLLIINVIDGFVFKELYLKQLLKVLSFIYSEPTELTYFLKVRETDFGARIVLGVFRPEAFYCESSPGRCLLMPRPIALSRGKRSL